MGCLAGSSVYIYYIHPEFRIGNCHSGSGEGAKLLRSEQCPVREHGGAVRRAAREQRFWLLVLEVA